MHEWYQDRPLNKKMWPCLGQAATSHHDSSQQHDAAFPLAQAAPGNRGSLEAEPQTRQQKVHQKSRFSQGASRGQVHHGPAFQGIKTSKQALHCRGKHCQSNQHRKGVTGYLPITVLVVSSEADEVDSRPGLRVAAVRHGNDGEISTQACCGSTSSTGSQHSKCPRLVQYTPSLGNVS